MSLINDALKRASQAPHPADVPLSGPLSPAPSNPKPRGAFVALLLAVLACVVALAGWFFWKGSSKPPPTRPVQTAQAKPNQAPKPVVPVAVPTTPVTTNVSTQEMAIVVPDEVSTNSVEATPEPPVATNAPTEASTAVVAPESTDPFPDLQVKAIAYHPTQGKALINNRAVGPGEEIDGVRVIKIEPNKVTVQWKGENKELFLQ